MQYIFGDCNIMASNQKFRPAFTKQEILYLIDILNRDKRDATAELAFTLAARLKVFALKADLGIVAPAFSSTEKQSLAEKLGMEDSDSLADKRRKAYEFCKANPTFCTPEQARLAKTYMYESGLMTPEQEAEYEQF